MGKPSASLNAPLPFRIGTRLVISVTIGWCARAGCCLLGVVVGVGASAAACWLLCCCQLALLKFA